MQQPGNEFCVNQVKVALNERFPGKSKEIKLLFEQDSSKKLERNLNEWLEI